MNSKLMAVAIAGALAACGGERGGESGAEATVQAAAPVETASAAAGVTDPEIAAIVVAANEVDVQAGELAREKASDPRVREFAERMVTDHTGVNQAASELVTRLGVTPEPSPTSRQLREGGEQARATLQALSGPEFDRAYIDHEVEYHRTVLDAINGTLIPNAQNAELRALLEQTAPAIEAHLEHARQIQGALGQG